VGKGSALAVDVMAREAMVNDGVSVGLSLVSDSYRPEPSHHIHPPIEVEVDVGPSPHVPPICCPCCLVCPPIDRGSCRSRRLAVRSLLLGVEERIRLWHTASGLQPVQAHLGEVTKASSGLGAGRATFLPSAMSRSVWFVSTDFNLCCPAVYMASSARAEICRMSRHELIIPGRQRERPVE